MAWLKRWFGQTETAPAVRLNDAQQARLSLWRQLPPADLQLAHARTRYVVADIESSGLNMKDDDLISIGAIAIQEARVDFTDSFEIVLRQEHASSHDNILIHGIDGTTQRQGVEPAEALLAFLDFVGNSPLVAYHAFFDEGMIGKAMTRYLGMTPKFNWLDLAWILPDLFPLHDHHRQSLDDWIDRFGIAIPVRHNAVFDACATAQLMLAAITAGERKAAATPSHFRSIEKARRWFP